MASSSSSSSVLKIWGCFHSSPSSTNNTSISSPFTSILSLTSSPSSSILSWSHKSRLDGSRANLRTHAKFEKFQGEEEEVSKTQTNLDQSVSSSSSSLVTQEQPVEEVEEDDSCLPNDLEGAVRQSSEAAAEFVSSGGMRAIVELLIPQLQFLDDEGAQGELWELSRIFLDTLIEETGCQRVKAIYPDAGAAALLKCRWEDAVFGFSSLSDRKPVESEDEIVVMVVPDYQMLEYVQRISANLSDDPPRPLIMWNPRLISEDVGVGFNVRNLRRYFLRTFTTVYSMRPLPSGAVYRCYPGSWKVFSDDKDRPNRYLLAKEQISRPDAAELEIIFGDVEEKAEKGPSLFTRVASIFSSMNRFMKIISR